MSKIRLVTFDVTHTLLKFRETPAKQYAKVGALYGIQVNEKKLSDSLKTNIKQLSNQHPNFGVSSIGWEKWWQEIVSKSFRDASDIQNKETLHQIAKDLISIFKTSACYEPTFGSMELLKYLKKREIPLGVVSNFDPRLPLILKNMKMYNFFKFVIYSYDIAAEKPYQKIFKTAITASGIENLTPNQVLHIGNSFELDYQGAKNTGMNAMLIADTNETLPPTVDMDDVFLSLSHVKDFLETSNKKYTSFKNKL